MILRAEKNDQETNCKKLDLMIFKNAQGEWNFKYEQSPQKWHDRN